MKIETVALDDQQTKLIAELDNATLEKYKHQAARKISQSAKIPGFRPGKAPYDLIRRMYGDEAIQQEAIELMMEDVYPQILKEANITPSGPGKLEEIVSYDPPTFAFVVPLPPAVTLGEYKELRKDYAPEPITDEQVEQALLRVRRSYAVAEPVERPAELGDLVSFVLTAKRAQPDEEGNDTLVERTPYQMIAGEQAETPNDDPAGEWPYQGFSQELIGLSAEESKTVTHTFSEESPYEDLRGQEAAFTIEVQNIKKMELPELDDEFAQTLGQFESVEALRNALRSQLEQNYSQQYDQKYYEDLIGQLVEQATIKYPPHLLEEEIEQFLEGVVHNLEHDRLDLDTYLKMRDMDRDTFIEQEVRPAAQRRLERSLVLEEFAKQEGVEVKSDEIRSVYYAAMQQMQQSPELRGAGKNKQSSQEMANNLAISTVNSIFNQRMMSRLKAIAIGRGDEAPEVEPLLAMDEAIALDPAVTEAPVTESSAPTSSAAAADEQTAGELELEQDEATIPEVPAESTPAEEFPVEESPVEETPAEDSATDETPAQE